MHIREILKHFDASPQCDAEAAVVSAVRSSAGLIAQSKRLHAINELQLEGQHPERQEEHPAAFQVSSDLT